MPLAIRGGDVLNRIDAQRGEHCRGEIAGRDEIDDDFGRVSIGRAENGAAAKTGSCQ